MQFQLLNTPEKDYNLTAENPYPSEAELLTSSKIFKVSGINPSRFPDDEKIQVKTNSDFGDAIIELIHSQKIPGLSCIVFIYFARKRGSKNVYCEITSM